MGGRQFEAEIREQPAVLARLAASQAAVRLDAAIGDREPLFIGSGSSLFVAQLGAVAWRRLGRRAGALAATEAHFQAAGHRDRCVVALSQSGRSADVLEALDALAPVRTIALTNDPDSPLAARADLTIDVQAGPERAVPASKSVTAMAALLLWAAAHGVGGDTAAAGELARAAVGIGAWLDGDGFAQVAAIAQRLEPAQSIVVIGAGYGVPVAAEVALKIKEASYRHAECFGAGEFRHGSTAILDATRGMIGIVDAESRSAVGAVLNVARDAHAITVALGEGLPDVPAFGPPMSGIFAPLSWIAGGQVLALTLARRAGIDSDTPARFAQILRMRQLTKIAVIYYSSTGNAFKVAQSIDAGAQSAGAEVRLRKVRELAPDEAIASNKGWAAHRVATQHVPEAELADLEWADGFAFGTPTRFGAMSAQLKQFLDTSGGLWMKGLLADKAATAFVGASYPHGGQETTLMTIYNMMYHWGAIIVPPSYTDPVVGKAGGNPYGTSYTDPRGGELPAELLAAAHYQGVRLARYAAVLAANRGALRGG